jgi:hypothetical protein
LYILQSIKESPTARKAEAHRRAVARKKAIDQQTRALRLHLGTPKMTKPRQFVQTDTYLEEVSQSFEIFMKYLTFINCDFYIIFRYI